MRKVSFARLFSNRGIGIVASIVLLAVLRIPAQAAENGARKETDLQPSESAGSGLVAGSLKAEPPAPTLSDVVELLRAQGQEIESLRAELRDQKEVTARLEAKLSAAGSEPIVAGADLPVISSPVTSSTAGSSAAPADLAQKVSQLETSVENSRNDFDKRLKSLGPFVFSGDFRLRAEPTFGGPANKSQDQLRERFRLRFNAEARLNDQINGGFSLASGDLNNPISTNQTTGQDTTRKPIEIDRAYATYRPHWLPNLTLTGGKFAYPWFNTELVWDKDINPEGAAETLAFNVETPVLKKFILVGFQLPFAETKRTATTNQSVYSTMVYGEQLQTFWQLSSRVRLSAYTGFYDWKNADAVALAVTVANGASPANGLLALSSNGLQNSIATVTTSNAITGAKTIASAQFASKFGILDSLAQIDVRTSSERWPVNFVGDFSENTRACENVPNILAGAVFSAPCDPHGRHGYWLEANVGRTLKKGDWQFSYTRFMIQREAVVGAFNYSEIFPSTNVEMHRPEILYQLFDNVTLQLNGLFGRPLVTGGSTVQPLWERLQFDMTYKF